MTVQAPDVESAWHDCLANGSNVVMQVEDVLRIGRRHLELDVVFISHVYESERVIRAVSASELSLASFVGQREALAGTHCELVLEGTLGPVVVDALADPLMRKVQQTYDFNMQAFVGVRIVLADGEVYGTLCGFAHTIRTDLGESVVRVLHFLANIVATQVDAEHAGGKAKRVLRKQFRQVIGAGLPRMVFQPIADLSNGVIASYEALARFDSAPERYPDEWFSMAHRVGLGDQLETLAIANSLLRVPALPAGCRLSVNISAACLCGDEVDAVLFAADLTKVVVEITEHEREIDLVRLLDVCRGLRRRGALIALDDFGSGYSGLDRVVRISPDRIKLDRVLVSGIDGNVSQQAMVAATVTYACRVEAEIVAEGIETSQELSMLRELGVSLGQGNLLAYPARDFLPGNSISWLSAAC